MTWLAGLQPIDLAAGSAITALGLGLLYHALWGWAGDWRRQIDRRDP